MGNKVKLNVCYGVCKNTFCGGKLYSKAKEYLCLFVFRGVHPDITILHRGVIEIYDNTTWEGGLPDFLQYYIRGAGGSLLGPQNNMSTTP